MDEFLKLRKRLLDALNKASKLYPGKGYEGEMTLSYWFPGIYECCDGEEDKYEKVKIHLDCYLIGPYRHYDWEGLTLDAAVKCASADIDTWIAEFIAECEEDIE